MATITVVPRSHFKKEIFVPGDKSISHRAAIFSALSNGRCELTHFSTGADCASTIECLKNLGVEITGAEDKITIHGVGLSGLHAPKVTLDCGNSGTTARLLMGLLAGQAFDSELIGDHSLSRRPMNRIIEPLRQMGANIDSKGFLPVKINGTSLRAINYTLPIASAQVKSGLLLSGLYAEGTTILREKTPTRDHTERMLPFISRSREGSETILTLLAKSIILARDRNIPGDISSAAFFLVAGAILDESKFVLKKVSLNPTRTGVLEVLKQAGCSVHISNRIDDDESYGDIEIQSHTGPWKPVSIDEPLLANIIDEIPILAVLGTRCGIEFNNAGELRKKESDRLDAIVVNLRAMGASVESWDNGFRVHPSRLTGADIDSRADHRIAMAFTIAGLAATAGKTTIHDPDCVAISFPEFYDYFELGDSSNSITP